MYEYTFIDMVSYQIDNLMLHISGKTYNFKEQLKVIGGKWDSKNNYWTIPNSPENIVLVKHMIAKKKVRTCGWCGEPGHSQPNCILKLTQTSKRLMKNPGPHFKKLKGTVHCSCCIIDDNVSGLPFPKTCHNCIEWCCKLAEPNIKYGFVCSVHGTSVEQFLNNTKGT